MLNVAAMTLTTSFKDLEVWQESMALVDDIYALSKSFPREELFGLTSQLRKAAVSIPSNIGEGSRRKRRRVLLNHLDIALEGRRARSMCRSRLRNDLGSAPHRITLEFRSEWIESGGC